MASTTEAMDSSAGSAEDLQTTPGTSATSNDQEDAAFEDADFAAGKMGRKVVTSRKTKKKERAATTAQLSQQENHPSGGQPLPLSIAEPHTCEDIDHWRESLRVTGAFRRKEQRSRRHMGGQGQGRYDDHAEGKNGTTTRTPEPPTDIETPLPVEIARQGEHREDSPAPKKRAVTQPRMAVRSDVKDAMEVMSENMRLMNESMMRMNEKMDMFNTRVQKMEMYLNNTVVPAIERMTSPHLGAHGPLHDAFTASEGGSDGQHGSDK
ncbi:hypothetical protein HPB50_009315 [Hyalomma asiaticum]|uniref:Uncharacterized protein n=1 Tax=Hyalomma asiaticum TaxID=266040 RepID=A0ACB7TEP5_HYAAI|nr:hypothetical protein HPB50_009315 [Hyalomma asiaticum]